MIRELWNRRRRDVRAALKMRRLIESGEMELHVVAVTPRGKEVKMTPQTLAQWEAMDSETRAIMLAALDRDV